MPRPPRLELPDGLFHVTARGNRRHAIFHDDLDRRLFVRLLHRTMWTRSWRMIAYCLLSNHFHLVIETKTLSLAAGMHQLNGTYARKFNERHGFDGHLFQGRYRAWPVESEEYLVKLIRYVALNPVRAGLCEHPSEWPWLSLGDLDYDSVLTL